MLGRERSSGRALLGGESSYEPISLSPRSLLVGPTIRLGTTASTADVGGTLPVDWPPTGAVDPLDATAVTAFYARGPQMGAMVRQQWTGIAVMPAVTR